MNVPRKKQFKYLLLLGTMLFSTAALFAQQGTIKGTVTDVNGDPIIGANVFIEGTTQGTVSDVNGAYTLPNIPAGTISLSVSFVGYLKETQSVPVTDGSISESNFVLIEDLQQLSEVVVIGYGTQKKSDLTGAITSVDAEDLQRLPNTGMTTLLQGMAAGVQVLQSSGQPGTNPVIRIRGLATVNGGSPLIVIDGISGGSLNDLNPADIESIEILKDAASQSIYGAAGGNGVILITTKKGQKGIRVQLDVFAGIQGPWKTNLGIADAQEYAAIYNKYQETRGSDIYFPNEGGVFLNPETNEPLTNTEWTNEIFRTAFVQNYNVSLSGGNKISTFFLGFNYNDEDGIVKKTNGKQYIVRLNSENKIGKRVTLGENLNLSQNRLQQQSEFNEYSSPLGTSIQMLPFIPIKATDGSGNFAYRDAGLSSNVTNPLAQIEYNNNFSKSRSIIGDVYGRVEIIKGLTFESRFGMGYNPTEYRQFVPSYIIGNLDNPSASQSVPNNQYTYNITMTNRWQWQNFFNYNFLLGNYHNFTLTGGMESTSSEYEVTNRTQAFEDDSLIFDPEEWEDFADADELDLLQPTVIRPTRSYAYFVRLNYDFRGILLFQGNFRRDYSSMFGQNQRVGNFPSFSVGIKFSEIAAVKNLGIFDFGKIRVGYGETGNSDIVPFQYLSTIGSLSMHDYPFSDVLINGAALVTAGNADLKWESVVTKNIGADFRFLKNRLSFSVDLFQRENKDMLLRKSVPLTVGYVVTDAGNELGDASRDTRPLVNYGTLNNKGFEFTATFKNKVGIFDYEVYANFTRAKTTIDDIGDPLYAGSGRGTANVNRTVNEGPIAAFYGYEIDGIYHEEDFTWYYTNRWRRVVEVEGGAIEVEGTDENGNPVVLTTNTMAAAPGTFRYVDTNGDGEITTDDMVQIGDPNPDFTYGFGANFAAWNFDLSLFFQGSYGNDIFNLMKVNTYNIDNGGLNISGELSDAFIPATYDAGTASSLPQQLTPAENTTTGIKRMDAVLTSSEFFVEDGSYLRLKNAQLGYTLTLEKVKIKKLRFYLGATNLLTFTKYSGFDPEVNERILGGTQTNILEKGFDRGTYPQARMFIFGLNCTF